MSGEHLPVIISFVVRWRGTAELTPLRSVRPSYRFLRPRSRENLSPAGTSHFPRPWVGHVRRTAPPGRRHVDEEDLHPEKRCKKTSFFSPLLKIQTNGVKSGRFLHRLVRSCGCQGQASGQVLHGHLQDTYRITLKNGVRKRHYFHHFRKFKQTG